MSDREAMKLALKALDTLVSPVGSIYAQARKALRAALAAPRPEIQVMVDPAALTAAAAYVPVRIVTPDDAEIAQAAKFEKAYQNNRAAPPPAAPRPEPEQKFDHSIGADRFKVVRGIFWWHIKIGDSPTEHGKFRSSGAAQKMADDLLREFRNGAFAQNALAAPSEDIEALRRENERLRGLLTDASKAVWMNYDGDLLDRIEAALKEVPR